MKTLKQGRQSRPSGTRTGSSPSRGTTFLYLAQGRLLSASGAASSKVLTSGLGSARLLPHRQHLQARECASLIASMSRFLLAQSQAPNCRRGRLVLGATACSGSVLIAVHGSTCLQKATLTRVAMGRLKIDPKETIADKLQAAENQLQAVPKLLPDYYQTITKPVPNYCQTIAKLLQNYCKTIAKQLTKQLSELLTGV